MSSRRRVALVGNPNSGKSSLFNQLTGLNQKVGNFPGVTVDKKTGSFSLDGETVEVVDLPGTYSIYPRSEDERVVTSTLLDTHNPVFPDLIVVTADASNLKRNLLLFTQVRDLGIPTILALNMVDLAERQGKGIDLELLAERFEAPVVAINARKGTGLEELKAAMTNIEAAQYSGRPFYDAHSLSGDLIDPNSSSTPYAQVQQAIQKGSLQEEELPPIQSKDTTMRYAKINKVVKEAVSDQAVSGLKLYSDKLDKIFTHKIWGYGIFLGILFLIFQAIFAWASWPMDLIDGFFSSLSASAGEVLPEGVLTDLLKDGIIPGIGGVLIFIPQIAILFTFIAILEESGYMARVVFLMDKIMRRFGLSGKSVVPLISGVACAIPAIMATRNIDSWKERMITIFVTPLMSCSARLPVYTILIALVIPEEQVYGFNLQGLVLLGMYLLGFVAALVSAWAMKLILKTKERSFLIMELPTYKMPRWGNVGLTIVEKVKTFSFEAGKVIIAISIVLWVLASYGPGDKMANAEKNVRSSELVEGMDESEIEDAIASYRLEHSYAGIAGKFIEPVIEPLGFNWKVGIALITSFAAREVFVGTMATLYSIESAGEDEATIKARMKSEINPKTGKAYFTLPVGIALMVFYAFAMQCMSTLAIVYRETKGWKWPLLQTAYMTGLAYVSAWIAFNIFS